MRVQFGETIDLAVNQRVHALSMLLESDLLAGVHETIPAYAALVVRYDPAIRTYEKITAWIRGQMDRVDAAAGRSPRQFEVPVRYGGASGLDLEAAAASSSLSASDVIRLHSERTYTVYMMGFTPGFPYMGTLHEKLRLPRLETPRTLVKAGTVAIAGDQTGIYPLDSPGGWRLIGWTSLRLFDPHRGEPFYFAPGDEVRFVPVEDFDA